MDYVEKNQLESKIKFYAEKSKFNRHSGYVKQEALTYDLPYFFSEILFHAEFVGKLTYDKLKRFEEEYNLTNSKEISVDLLIEDSILRVVNGEVIVPQKTEYLLGLYKKDLSHFVSEYRNAIRELSEVLDFITLLEEKADKHCIILSKKKLEEIYEQFSTVYFDMPVLNYFEENEIFIDYNREFYVIKLSTFYSYDYWGRYSADIVSLLWSKMLKRNSADTRKSYFNKWIDITKSFGDGCIVTELSEKHMTESSLDKLLEELYQKVLSEPDLKSSGESEIRKLWWDDLSNRYLHDKQIECPETARLTDKSSFAMFDEYNSFIKKHKMERHQITRRLYRSIIECLLNNERTFTEGGQSYLDKLLFVAKERPYIWFALYNIIPHLKPELIPKYLQTLDYHYLFLNFIREVPVNFSLPGYHHLSEIDELKIKQELFIDCYKLAYNYFEKVQLAKKDGILDNEKDYTYFLKLLFGEISKILRETRYRAEPDLLKKYNSLIEYLFNPTKKEIECLESQLIKLLGRSSNSRRDFFFEGYFYIIGQVLSVTDYSIRDYSDLILDRYRLELDSFPPDWSFNFDSVGVVNWTSIIYYLFINNKHLDFLEEPEFNVDLKRIELSDFEVDEFHFFDKELSAKESVKKFCLTLEGDVKGINLKAERLSIEWLNELLTVESLSDDLKSLKKIDYSKEIEILKKKNHDCSSKERKRAMIRLGNRYVLEEFYDSVPMLNNKLNEYCYNRVNMLWLHLYILINAYKGIINGSIYNNQNIEILLSGLEKKIVDVIVKYSNIDGHNYHQLFRDFSDENDGNFILIREVADFINYCEKWEVKRSIFEAFCRARNPLLYTIILYNQIHVDSERIYLRDKIKKMDISHFLENDYSFSKFEIVLREMVNSGDLVEMGGNIINYYRKRFIDRGHPLVTLPAIKQYYTLRLAITILKGDDSSFIFEEIKENKDINLNDDRIYFEALYAADNDNFKEAGRLLSDLEQKYPEKSLYKVLVLYFNVYGESKKELKNVQLFIDSLKKVEKVKKDYYSRTINIIELICYHYLDNNIEFDKIYSSLTRGEKFKDNIINMYFDNLLKRKEYNKAVNFIEQCKNNKVNADLIKSLEEQFGEIKETAPYLRNAYQMILSSQMAVKTEVVPNGINPFSKKGVGDFFAYEICWVANELLKKIKTANKIFEDDYTDILLILLKSRLSMLKIDIQDHPRQGESETSKSIGLPDLTISGQGRDIVVEAVRFNRNTAESTNWIKLKEHIIKANNSYSVSRKLIFNIVYYEHKDFKVNWKLFLIKLMEDDFLGELKPIEDVREKEIVDNNSIKVAFSKHKNDCSIYHIFINVGYLG